MLVQTAPVTFLTDDDLAAELASIEAQYADYATCPPEALHRHTCLIRERMRRPMTLKLASSVPASLAWMRI